MSDHNLIDDPLVSFDEEQQLSPTKVKTNDAFENRLLDDIDPFGNHNGQENHRNGTDHTKDNSSNPFLLTNELFPVDSNANATFTHDEFSTHKNDATDDSPLNTQSQLNGTEVDKDTLLLELDPNAPPTEHTTNAYTPSPNDPFKQFSNISPQQENKADNILDFEGVTEKQESDLTSFNNPLFDVNQTSTEENKLLSPETSQSEQELLRQASEELDSAAHELEQKLDLITASPITPDHSEQQQQLPDSTQSKIEENPPATPTKVDSTLPKPTPEKKPTTTTTRPTSAGKPKPSASATATSKSTEHKPSSTSKTTEHKPATAAAAGSTTKSTEVKTTSTTRKTIHSGPTASAAAASSKPKVASTSPTEAPKPTRDTTAKVHSAPIKPKPVASSSSTAAGTTATSSTTTTTTTTRSTIKPVTKPIRPSTVPKTSDQTTTLSTAPEGSASSSSTVPTASAARPSTRPPQPSARPPTKATTSSTTASSSHTASSTTVSRTTVSASKTTVSKPRPSSHTRTTASRPATATSASSTAAPKRSSSASRPSTSDTTSRVARSTAVDSASGTTVTVAKPQWNSVTSKVGSLQNAAHKSGGGAVKIPTQKLNWNAKSKIGSLDNAHHKPGGGAIKIESKKLDFKEKAKPRTNSGKPGDGNHASATANNEHHKEDETSDEVFESNKDDNGDKQNK